jgi:hypothetical protein
MKEDSLKPATPAVAPIPPRADQHGLTCLQCGCRHFEVLYTRRALGGKLIRRRACRHCGRRLTTSETRLG